MIATVLAYGFMTGWMPFANWSDNYLSVFSSLLIFVELSFVQAIRAGMVEENGWNKSWIGIALFGLNVVWMVVLIGSMIWNAFEETWKRCLGWTGGGADGAGDEEQGVATLEEARAVIAVRDASLVQRDATIAEHVASIEEPSDEIAELRATIAELRATIGQSRDRRLTRQGSSGDIAVPKRTMSARRPADVDI